MKKSLIILMGIFAVIGVGYGIGYLPDISDVFAGGFVETAGGIVTCGMPLFYISKQQELTDSFDNRNSHFANRRTDLLDMYGGGEQFDAFDNTLDLTNNWAGNVENAVKQISAKVKAIKGMVQSGAPDASLPAILKRLVGTLTVNITRPTANINEPLPVVIFGKNAAESFYKSIITFPLLPVGAVFTGLSKGTFANPNAYVFEFTDAPTGLLVDTIVVEINSDDITYPEFLSYLGTNIFKAGKIRHKLNNTSATALTTQDQAIRQFNNSMFGKGVKDSVVPSDYIDPMQQQTRVIDIPYPFDIDQQKGLATRLAPVAGLVLSLSLPITNVIQNKA